MKKIAVINDISGFGRCSMTAAVPVISALGAEACPLPTGILSNQTGYPSFFCDDFTDRIAPYVQEWIKLGAQFDAIVTGFLVSPAQADSILQFLKTFKKQNTLYICDPVMADEGRLYGTYTPALCEKMAELVHMADIITPNLTELCILNGADYHKLLEAEGQAVYLQTVLSMARSLLHAQLQTVIVTGVPQGDSILNVLVTPQYSKVFSGKRIGGSYSGTGDLFSAVVAGMLTDGFSAEQAVSCAAAFLQASIQDAFANGNDRNDGVNFQKYLYMLTEKVREKYV